jgi:hypothetical protein
MPGGHGAASPGRRRAVEHAEVIGPISLRAGRRSSWSGVREPQRMVTRPLRPTPWASCSQVLRQLSWPTVAICHVRSASKTSQSGSSPRSGPVTVVLPVPLGPVTTNSGMAGIRCASPHRGHRSVSDSRVIDASGPQFMQKTPATGYRHGRRTLPPDGGTVALRVNLCHAHHRVPFRAPGRPSSWPRRPGAFSVTS